MAPARWHSTGVGLQVYLERRDLKRAQTQLASKVDMHAYDWQHASERRVWSSSALLNTTSSASLNTQLADINVVEVGDHTYGGRVFSSAT